MKYGKIHRDNNKPALIYKEGDCEYWDNDVCISFEMKLNKDYSDQGMLLIEEFPDIFI